MGWLRVVSLLTVVSVFGLVILGGVVRVTESGLGCPDWPLCYGKVLPPLEMTAIIEYTHRLVASAIVSPLVIATCVLAWVVKFPEREPVESGGLNRAASTSFPAAPRRERWLVVPSTLAIVFLLGQAILGGITVIQELPGFLVLAHLALAQALLACMTLVAVVAYRGPLTLGAARKLADTAPSNAPDSTSFASGAPAGDASAELPAHPTIDKFPLLALASAVGVYIVMLSGSLVTATGATPACVTWPLCQGDLMPEHPLAAIHMGHRYVAAIIGVFLLYTLHVGIRGRRRPAGGSRPQVSHRAERYLSMLALGLFMAQILVGWWTVWGSFIPELKALHLAMATAVWLAVAALAVTSLTRPGYGGASPESPGL